MNNNVSVNISSTLLAEEERRTVEHMLRCDLRRHWRHRRLQAKAAVYVLAVLVALPMAVAAMHGVPEQLADGTRLSAGTSRSAAMATIGNVIALV